MGVAVVFCVNAIAAGGTLKIGYVDVTGAATQSQWGKKVTEDLKKEQERLGSAVEQKKQAFVAARDDYEKKKDAMDEKARARKQKELQDMYAELEKLATESSTKWNDQAKAVREPIFKKIMEIANKIAKDDKYDFIIEKSALLVGNDKDDITLRVVSELDKSAPK
jgi:Skp family chaperone for outer membrane proteins